MKKVIVFRHGPKATGSSKGGAVGLSVPLSKEGEEVVRQIASDFLKKSGKPRMILTSPSVRTYQTSMIFAEVCEVDPPEIIDEFAGRFQEWDKIACSMEDPTALDFYQANPQFVRNEANNLLEAIQEIAESLNDDENAICVGHGGLIEPTMSLATLTIKESNLTDLTTYFPSDLKEGEAAVFVFDKNNKLIDVQ